MRLRKTTRRRSRSPSWQGLSVIGSFPTAILVHSYAGLGGAKPIFVDVRFSVAIGCKADIGRRGRNDAIDENGAPSLRSLKTGETISGQRSSNRVSSVLLPPSV